MKVLLCGLTNDRVEFRLVRELGGAGVDFFVVATPGSPAVALCRELGLPMVEYACRNRFDRKAVLLYRELLAAHRFDVVHALSNRALSTALQASRKMERPPRIVAYRGTMGHLSWLDPASHFSYLNRRVDCIVCVSDAVRRYLKTFRIPDERLAVIWKGHDPAWYTAAPREALAELGVPREAMVVNFTGNIRPVKGVDYLLKAFAGIRPEEHIHLLLVGEIRERRIRELVMGHPHIHAAGFRKDAAALVGACDVAVMPSIEREGLPKAVIEAMAQGVPAVVSDVGGMPELVEHERSGLVVPPKNAAALAAAIRRLAANPDLRKGLGEAARERIKGPFHFRHTVEKTRAVYERVLMH